MPSGSFKGRPGHHPVKKMCTKCKRSEAAHGKDLCLGCIKFSPEVRNSPAPRHPRQR